MSIFEHIYYKRAKCDACSNILWTTDDHSSVRCTCRDVIVTPDGVEGAHTDPSDVEHRAAIKAGFNLPESDTVYLIKG